MSRETSDDQQDDFELDEADDTEETSEEVETEETEETNEESDKRVRELQSARDKETARANRLEKELAKLQTRDEGSTGTTDPVRQAELEEIRQDRLDSLLATEEFQPLKSYGIDPALITGTSRAEMRESAQELVGFIKSIETKVRNKTLREAGITPSPTSGTREPRKDYSKMSDEDFEKELNRALSGGKDPVW